MLAAGCARCLLVALQPRPAPTNDDALKRNNCDVLKYFSIKSHFGGSESLSFFFGVAVSIKTRIKNSVD